MQPVLFLSVLLALLSCKKNSTNSGNGNTNQQLGYGDSVFYIGAQEYVVSPTNSGAGTYTPSLITW